MKPVLRHGVRGQLEQQVDAAAAAAIVGWGAGRTGGVRISVCEAVY
jgi:hypothetical protein